MQPAYVSGIKNLNEHFQFAPLYRSQLHAHIEYRHIFHISFTFLMWILYFFKWTKYSIMKHVIDMWFSFHFKHFLFCRVIIHFHLNDQDWKVQDRRHVSCTCIAIRAEVRSKWQTCCNHNLRFVPGLNRSFCIAGCSLDILEVHKFGLKKIK